MVLNEPTPATLYKQPNVEASGDVISAEAAAAKAITFMGLFLVATILKMSRKLIVVVRKAADDFCMCYLERRQ